MNAKLLRRIAKHIAAEPKRFIMGDVMQTTDNYDQVHEYDDVNGPNRFEFAECGTAACVAGWACILSGDTHATWGKGMDFLAIDGEQADRLFALSNWPDKFRLAFVNAKTLRGRASAAVRRLEHFSKTKGKS